MKKAISKRCWLCAYKEDPKTGLCTNPKCPRSKPLSVVADE